MATVALMELCIALLAKPPPALLSSPQGVMVESAAVFIIHRCGSAPRFSLSFPAVLLK